MKNKLSYFTLAAAILAADQLTKAWAIAKLKPVVLIDVIPGYFRLLYATNRGVAFSLFADGEFDARWVFASISVLAALFVCGYLVRTSPSKLRLNISLALLLAGIVGNLVDRVRLGEVVDFLSFHIHDKYSWPIFNVADSAICIGAGLLALEMIFEEKPVARKVGGTSVAEEQTQPETQIHG
ncbi:MAG: signal peptidase II [Acidobacteriota bacterium]|nr:signal peptidase II [Acidobacteriota bacterium]